MDKYHFSHSKNAVICILLLCAAATFGVAWLYAAQSTGGAGSDDNALLEGFRRVEVASVSDALEQLTGKPMYMSHRMQPIFAAKFAGFALTVRLKKDEGNSDAGALYGMLAAIDAGN